MVRYILYSIGLLIIAGAIFYLLTKKDYASDDATLTAGKALFTKSCMSCHALQDDGIGPPLGGITTLLSKKKLLNFINHPSTVIESGDERAMAMQARYKLVMPSFDWMKEPQISSILAYIDSQTKLHHIEPLAINKDSGAAGLKGRLVLPVKKSGMKIELEDVVQLPQLNKTTDLGVVTLRAHPSGDGTLFASDQNGIIYRIRDGKAATFLDVRAQIKDFQSGPGIATGIASFDFHPDFLKNGLIYIMIFYFALD